SRPPHVLHFSSGACDYTNIPVCLFLKFCPSPLPRMSPPLFSTPPPPPPPNPPFNLPQAGLVPALLSALSRRPSQLCYWVAINLGVAGARHLEMQWLMLVIARMSVLPPSLSTPEASTKTAGAADTVATQPAALDSSQAAARGAADSHEAAAAASSSGKGGHSTTGARAQRGRSQRNGVQDPVKAAAEAERLRLAAVDLLLQSCMLNSLSVDSARSTPAAAEAERRATLPPPPPPPAEAEAEVATRGEEAETDAETGGAGYDAAALEYTATSAAEASTTLSAVKLVCMWSAFTCHPPYGREVGDPVSILIINKCYLMKVY
ncbi:hypothetical protein Vretimale_9919, partial [Volvox reticuliferus]